MSRLGGGRSRRWRLAVLVAAVLGGVAVLAGAGLGDAAVYYRTPTEVVARPPLPQERLRLGGLVAPGTVRRDGDTVRFTLTDGAWDVAVSSRAAPPQTFREGEGAVVEGTLGTDGVFSADQVLVRHSNEYRPPAPAADPAARAG